MLKKYFDTFLALLSQFETHRDQLRLKKSQVDSEMHKVTQRGSVRLVSAMCLVTGILATFLRVSILTYYIRFI